MKQTWILIQTACVEQNWQKRQQEVTLGDTEQNWQKRQQEVTLADTEQITNKLGEETNLIAFLVQQYWDPPLNWSTPAPDKIKQCKTWQKQRQCGI